MLTIYITFNYQYNTWVSTHDLWTLVTTAQVHCTMQGSMGWMVLLLTVLSWCTCFQLCPQCTAQHQLRSDCNLTTEHTATLLTQHAKQPNAKYGYLIQLCQMLCWFAIWFLLDLPSFRMYRIIRIRRMGIFSWFIILHFYQWRNNSQYFDRENRQS